MLSTKGKNKAILNEELALTWPTFLQGRYFNDFPS